MTNHDHLVIKPKKDSLDRLKGIPESTRNVLITSAISLLALALQYGCAVKDARKCQEKIQTLENEVQPFRILALQKLGSMDTASMSNLVLILKDLDAKYRHQILEISNLNQILQIQTDPKTQAENLHKNVHYETIRGYNTNKVSYHFAAHIVNRIFLRLDHAPLANSLNITLSDPITHQQIDLMKGLTFRNVSINTFGIDSEPLPISNFLFAVSYIINPNETNIVKTVRMWGNAVLLDDEPLDLGPPRQQTQTP